MNEGQNPLKVMRCARCLRDDPSVHARPRFCPAYLCDICNEYEETWDAYKQESGNNVHTEFHRLYDRLGELRAKIDEILKGQTFRPRGTLVHGSA